MNIVSGAVCDYEPEKVRGGMLADAMGLGKSLTVTALIATDRSDPVNGTQGSDRYPGKDPWTPGPTLLVIPPSLLRTWQEELHKYVVPGALSCCSHHGPKRSNNVSIFCANHIVLTTYDVVSAEWRRLDTGLKPLYSMDWHRIVLDEGEFLARVS